ncbi:precorrin-8X methylmutase [Synechococcus sp. CBW1004]|uniref:precorrin-8X methylmutase n=1 Tax=Synechococcus sp. CBW1004 TaxID=1353136 RepID=UPI0018CF8E2F|nr:precorrin-8X methylmutase [Synechococcus sp. CBW1004]QPN62523.1 precorrin-8X methylmutase [Synechococcus sp. CBW1004]
MQDHPIFTESIRRIRELLAAQAEADPALAAWLAGLSALERDVLERCIHSSGDVSIAADLRFSPVDRRLIAPAAAAGARSIGGSEAGLLSAADSDAAAFRSSSGAPQGACGRGLAALRAGAPILTDTAMAAAAVAPMARRTSGNRVACLLDWAPDLAPAGSTRAAVGMERAWAELAAGGSGPPPHGADSPPAPVVLIGSAPTALERLLDLVAAGALAPSLLIGMPVGFVGVAESKRHLAEAGLDHIRLEGSRGGAGLVAAACNALLRAGGPVAENPPSLS